MKFLCFGPSLSMSAAISIIMLEMFYNSPVGKAASLNGCRYSAPSNFHFSLHFNQIMTETGHPSFSLNPLQGLLCPLVIQGPLQGFQSIPAKFQVFVDFCMQISFLLGFLYPNFWAPIATRGALGNSVFLLLLLLLPRVHSQISKEALAFKPFLAIKPCITLTLK